MQKKKSYNSKKPTNTRQGGKARNQGTNKRWNPDVDKASDMREGKFTSARNDWRWYATNPQLVKDSASYPFGYALGTRVDYGTYGTEASKLAVPGICSLAFAPTVGYSDHANSPINVASRKIYSDIRHTNSGAANYDPVDLMIYLVGMDSCYMMMEHYKRAYGVARTISPVNRYLAEALVSAMGFDYDSLIANLDDFRAMINTYAQKLKSLVIPNGMSYMAKHQWLVSGVYQDNPNDKSQLYVFIPKVYYRFTLDSDGAGMLRADPWANVGVTTFAQAQTILNNLLDPLLANQDFSIISGDILKWRGEGGVVIPTGITETYQIFPVYDETVLDQIQNATLVGQGAAWDTPASLSPPVADNILQIKQDPSKSWLVSTPWFRHYWKWSSNDPNPGRNAYLSRKLVNFTHGNVQPEEVMEATRLTNIADVFAQNTAGYDWFRFRTLGSEVIMDAYFWFYHEDSNGVWTLDKWRVQCMSDVFIISVGSQGMNASDFQYTADELRDFLTEVNMISDFNRHPFIALSGGVVDDDNVVTSVYAPFRGYLGDVDYYTILDTQDLSQMSEVALMSEFNVRMEG